MSDGSWQTEVVDALEASGGESVALMSEATGWAVKGTTKAYYIVLVAGEATQTLKVCLSPEIPDARISRAVAQLAERPTGPQCYFLGGDFNVDAHGDPEDEHSFIYHADDGISNLIGKPCRGYRFRDHCRHVDLVPGDTILRRQ